MNANLDIAIQGWYFCLEVDFISLKLVEPSYTYKEEYIEMIKEWRGAGEKIYPFVLRIDYADFDALLFQIDNLKNGINLRENSVSSSTFWLVDDIENIVIGAVNIRHYLNDILMREGGHIGYGIRPSMRRKGYASKLLNLSLMKAKNLNIQRVFLICDKDNIGSAKTIINNGGILDSEDIVEGIEIQRYWVECD